MQASLLSRLSFTVALILSFAATRLDAKSIIVDDADTTNITYSSGWNIGNDCGGCFANPNKSKAFDGTWHEGIASGSTNLSFTFTFTGTSVEARYIAIDIIYTNVSYWIDGVQRGIFVRNPARLDTYFYNQSLLSVEGLTNVEHTLRVDLLEPSVLLLDYLIYDDGSAMISPIATPDSPSSPPSSNVGAIIGGATAGVIVVILCCTLVWYLKSRSLKTSWGARGSTLPSEDDDLSRPLFLPPAAQTLSMAEITQTGEKLKPKQPNSSHTTNHTSSLMDSKLYEKSLIGTNRGSLPAVPEAYQPPNVDEVPPAGIPRHSERDTTTAGVPSSSFYNSSVASLVQPQIPDGLFEESRRRASIGTTLPPYSPGGFSDNGDAPPLPQR